MDPGQAQRQMTTDLTPLYGSREAMLIADWVMEHLTGRRRLDRLTKPAEPLTDPQLKQFYVCRSELLAHRPVQYVLHESWFAGLRFYVDENVLIPRPETEELVQWAIQTITSPPSPTTLANPSTPNPPSSTPTPSTPPSGPLLDVGTGSGCIAITLAGQLPSLPIHACDVSTGALHVAQRNATQHNARVTLHHLDFLDRNTWTSLPPIKWLISNPPYIPAHQRSTLAPHVVDSEPALALFVPESDPLVFYRALAEFARRQLIPGGAVLAETHEDKTSAVAEVFRATGAVTVETRKDLMGKDRMIKATW
ncbi:MAG TPA: peptide chain release factor N(5)-glutamine methyltransferase [Puia sp.]|jgi:release factor glutamine methyltransferase|nr:peptide chain release factor N(5)-glutamine methyltransferase [Puia sp.]